MVGFYGFLWLAGGLDLFKLMSPVFLRLGFYVLFSPFCRVAGLCFSQIFPGFSVNYKGFALCLSTVCFGLF